MRAAEAASDTSVLIEESAQKIGAGNTLVAKVKTTFGHVSESTGQVNTIVSEISIASANQATGVEHINTSLTKIDDITQRGAAQAEETVSASKELSAQAVELEQIVNQLALVVGGVKVD